MSSFRVLLLRAVSKRCNAPNNTSFAHKIVPSLRFYCNVPAVSSPQKDFPENSSQNRQDQSDLSIFGPADLSELSDIGRNLKPSYTFAAYVNDSETLQQLVKLGVDLSKIERKRDLGEYVLQLDFERDVKPYVQFLHDHGVAPEKLGEVLTKNISICRVPLDDLQVRINYLESKNFDRDMIAGIITRNPLWLTTPVSVIDARLGWLQTNFKLTGDDVRLIVNSLPQLVTFTINTIKLNMFVFEEEMGMSKGMMRSMLLKRPRLFIKSKYKILAVNCFFTISHKVFHVLVFGKFIESVSLSHT